MSFDLAVVKAKVSCSSPAVQAPFRWANNRTSSPTAIPNCWYKFVCRISGNHQPSIVCVRSALALHAHFTIHFLSPVCCYCLKSTPENFRTQTKRVTMKLIYLMGLLALLAIMASPAAASAGSRVSATLIPIDDMQTSLFRHGLNPCSKLVLCTSSLCWCCKHLRLAADACYKKVFVLLSHYLFHYFSTR